MKIVFILPSLKGGGAERVILTLANGFKKRGNDVAVGFVLFEDMNFCI